MDDRRSPPQRASPRFSARARVLPEPGSGTARAITALALFLGGAAFGLWSGRTLIRPAGPVSPPAAPPAAAASPSKTAPAPSQKAMPASGMASLDLAEWDIRRDAVRGTTLVRGKILNLGEIEVNGTVVTVWGEKDGKSGPIAQSESRSANPGHLLAGESAGFEVEFAGEIHPGGIRIDTWERAEIFLPLPSANERASTAPTPAGTAGSRP